MIPVVGLLNAFAAGMCAMGVVHSMWNDEPGWAWLNVGLVLLNVGCIIALTR